MRKTADKIKCYVQAKPHAFITDEAYQLASLRYAPDMADVLWEVKRAFAKGIAPEQSQHGSSPTYFLKDCEGRPIGVFKEYKSLHELAAYRLDREHFAGVPQTVITTLEHAVLGGRKTGSCQFFVHDAVVVMEVDHSVLEQFCPASVRRVATLDIRVMNDDRNNANILAVNQKELVPIDHGYIFPRSLSSLHFSWMGWKQSATQFTESELSYIAGLDPERDRRLLLDEIRLEEISANRVFLATIMLKRGAARGFSAHKMGSLLLRPSKKDGISPFENLIETIKEINPLSWQLFSRLAYDEVEKLFDRYQSI